MEEKTTKSGIEEAKAENQETDSPHMDGMSFSEAGEIATVMKILSDTEKPVPNSFKAGRDPLLQLAKVDRGLFTEMEEKQSGNYIIRGVERKISELDFEAFTLAMGQLLYNQSYQFGNTDENTGVSKGIAKRLSERTGHTYYRGEIYASLTDICRAAYGTENPSTDQKKAMDKLIKTLHDTPVHIDFPNGDSLDQWLCVKTDEFTRHRDGAKIYNLILNPIFCNRVTNQFAEFPQDITKRLNGSTGKKGRLTSAHYRLLKLLGCQKKSEPFYRNIWTLLEELRLYEAYQEQPSRTEKQLLSLFESMKTVGILKNYDITKEKVGRRANAVSKITFYLNPKFIERKGKKEKEEPEETAPDKTS